MSQNGITQPLAVEQLDSLVKIIDLVRTGAATTRPEIGRVSGLGRSIVTQRVEQAIDLGLLADTELGPSTGGRAPRQLRFCAERAHLLVVVFGALNVGVAVTDLAGRVIATSHENWDISQGPEASLQHVAKRLDALLADLPAAEIWGVGIGVPGPVEFLTGHPVAPPIMPGWNAFDIRGWFQQRYNAPVWVDNDVNMMALGEWSRREKLDNNDMLYVKVGSGIGAGLISGGHLHRGANGSAGDVGHIAVTDQPGIVCRCGQLGCLEAVAGGWALARDGEIAAKAGKSPYLAQVLQERGVINPGDVADGARNGDATCVELVAKSGRVVGETLATLVNFFNPSLVAVGGTIATTGDLFLAAVRQTVYRRSLPLATRDLRIVPASIEHSEGLAGAAQLVVEQLFDHGAMYRWLAAGSPAHDLEGLYRVA